MSAILNFNYQVVTEPVSQVAVQAYNSACTAVTYLGGKCVELTHQALTYSSPYIQNLALKTSELWSQSQPHIATFWTTFVQFVRSPLGTAISLLVTTIVLMKLSQMTEDKIATLFFMTLGIIAAVASGAFLLQAGFLPPPAFAQT